VTIDQDKEVLAAEYVLGTLGPDERTEAQGLITADAAFAEVVRGWERRLGELSAMVDPVEPPADMWERIKAGVAISAKLMEPAIEALKPTTDPTAKPEAAAPAPGAPIAEPAAPAVPPTPPMPRPPPAAAVAPAPPPVAPPAPPPAAGTPPVPPLATRPTAPAAGRPEPSAAAPPAAAATPPAAAATPPAAAMTPPAPAARTPPVPPAAIRPEPPHVRPEPPALERKPTLRAPVEFVVLPGAAAGGAGAAVPPAGTQGAEVIELSRRVKRWRTATMLTGALAACLLALVVVREANPDLLPSALQSKEKVVVKTVEVPSAQPAEFVAVFQKDDASPAFLLTFDLDKRSLTVRRVGAEQQAGKSYELWLVSDKYPGPRSLGVIGAAPYTVKHAAAQYDPVVLNRATFAISLEPEGGSPTGAPTGPVLYHGRLVQTTAPDFPARAP